ncbi:TadE/TadG family type IV pilus assembly protein [Neobacillus kokaensis]|uniref:Putative Flp pilus-assembly TadG-like N-terminal domain-containing protein n=1 Tax=Neobacillus kokaensis TaxID=2759023 RepID=A0ABQ3MYS7_9BACI|nr:TadE/TadG family type IV pilus assembly protein [Neobacillus kokaensis]GHH97577.1 hypothetical protein AM1BK_11200 [Neobacillus kokaensis]
MKRFLKLLNLRDESGATFVIIAISMVALLGFCAITIDGGRLYLEKSKLQKALDAAVLAGAHKLVLAEKTESEDQARTVAKDISSKNGFELLDADIKEVVQKSNIKVAKTVTVPLTFAKVIGMNSADVSASAKASIDGSLKSTNGIAPIGVEKDSVVQNKEIRITCTGNEKDESGKNSPGNCGFLRIDGTGAAKVEEGIKNGSKKTVKIGDTPHPEPGVMNGPIDKAVELAIDSLINSDKDKEWCQSAATADNNCKRVIYVVVVKTWEGINGASDTVEIIGFAPFWVKEYDNKNNNEDKDNDKSKSIVGQFINAVNSGDSDSSSNYGLYKVKLDE